MKVLILIGEVVVLSALFAFAFGVGDAIIFVGLCVALIGGAILFIPSEQEARRIRHPLRSWRDDSGSASVEFAFTAAPFLALLILPVVAIFIGMTAVDLQRATDRAAQKIATGEITVDGFEAAVCSDLIMVSCSDGKVSFDREGPQEIGGADQFIVFRASYPSPIPYVARVQTATAAVFDKPDCERFVPCVSFNNPQQ